MISATTLRTKPRSQISTIAEEVSVSKQKREHIVKKERIGGQKGKSEKRAFNFFRRIRSIGKNPRNTPILSVVTEKIEGRMGKI